MRTNRIFYKRLYDDPSFWGNTTSDIPTKLKVFDLSFAQKKKR